MHDVPIVCVCIILDLHACVRFYSTPLSSPSFFFFVSNVTETDDYAEIVDEEDTYTMPSSKYLIQSSLLSEFVLQKRASENYILTVGLLLFCQMLTFSFIWFRYLKAERGVKLFQGTHIREAALNRV